LLRGAAVWWADGQFNQIHMHGVEGAALHRKVCDAHLDGYGGDFILVGMCLGDTSSHDRFSPTLAAARMHADPDFLGDLGSSEALGRTDYYFIENRARRIYNIVTRYMQAVVEERKPILASAVVEFAFALPDAIRARGQLYRRMLIREFPEYYRRIPWASLGVPISWPRGARRAGKWLLQNGRRCGDRVSAICVPRRYWTDYTDYPVWLGEAPALQFFDRLFRDPEALNPQYTSRQEVLTMREAHPAGDDHAWELGRRATLGIWLQQVYAGRLRPTDPDLGARRE